jgi:LuxR family transcriptional regulator, maltose regulon positive regulatory protein
MAGRTDPRYVIPQLHAFEVKRTHLLERLNASQAKRLVLTVAPAGYGKSTLVAQFARATSRAVAWVNLSAEDSEALVLGRSIAQAARIALPKVALTRWERTASRDPSNEQLATALAADLNLLSEDLIIVLETLEHLSEESGRWVTAFLGRLGEGHQVVATSWDWGGDVAVDFSRFVADGRALVINQDDLTFTLEETTNLFLQANSKLDAQQVWEAVEGWPVALGMILYGAPLQGTPQDLIKGILRNLPEATRNNLPEAAALTTWSEEGASRLGLNLPKLWLHDVQRSGLPLQTLGSNRYQPHKVLQNTLEEMLQTQPERHAALHLEAAKLAEASGDLITAVNHFRTATHFDQAQRVLEGLLPRYQRRSEWTLIRKLLEPFPLDSLSPYAATMLGTALVETRSTDIGNRILHQQLVQGEASGATYFALTLTAFRHGAFEHVLHLADAGLAIARNERDATELLRVKAAALALSNRAEEAHVVAEECARRAERQGEPGLLAHALSVQQFVLGRLNRYEESLEVGQRAIDLALYRDAPKKAMPAVNSYAETLWLLGRAEEAYTVIEQMLHKSDHDYPLAKPFMISQRARIYEQLEQYQEAHQNYQIAGELFLTFENKSEASEAFANAADMLLHLGRDEQAQKLLSQANSYVHSNDLSKQVCIKRVEGTLYLLRNHLDRAQETFEWVLRSAKQLNNNFEIIIARGYLNAIAKQQGTLNYSLVEMFIHELDTFGHDWILRRYTGAWRDFYRECIDNGWYTTRLRPYLNLRTPAFSPPAKPKLELKLFGTFHARLANTEVKLSSRPQEVLAYLVIHGSTRIDVLADAIWPDATSRSAKRNLAQQIRALRETLAQALGSSPNLLMTEEGSYRLSDSIEVQSDTGALEKAAHNLNSDEMLQAVRSYEGELLPHIYSEWVLQSRCHYEHIAASLALTMARQQKPTSVQLAIELYEKAIHIDPSLEEAYNELTQAYENTNNYSAALRVQHRWKDFERNLNFS